MGHTVQLFTLINLHAQVSVRLLSPSALACLPLLIEIVSPCSIACLAALQRHGECLAIINRRLEDEKGNTDLYVMRSRLHMMFKNVSAARVGIEAMLLLDTQGCRLNVA